MKIILRAIFFISLFGQVLVSQAGESAPFIPRDMTLCDSVENAGRYGRTCKEVLSLAESKAAISTINEQKFLFHVENDTLLMAVRMPASDFRYADKPFICCEIQAYLEKIGEGIYGAKFRWDAMSGAMLDLFVANARTAPEGNFSFNGSREFFMEQKRIDNDIFKLHDIEKTEASWFMSAERGSRSLTILKGRACHGNLAHCTVIYMPDGHSVTTLVKNSLLRHIPIDRYVFVGIHNDAVDSINSRIFELLFDYDVQRYDSFMQFATDDVVKKVEGASRPARRFVAGYSNGGAWALDVLFKKPALFNGAIAMSIAQWDFKSDADLTGHIVFVGAGTMETSFYSNSTKIAAGLKARHALVSERYPPSGHSMTTWLNIWNGALTALNQSAEPALALSR